MPSLIAVVAAIASALMLGISSVADQRSTKRVESRRALSPRILLDLARQPLWLTALGANLVGFALQVVALNFGSLALVQPILVCDLIFAVLILWFLRRRSGARARGARATDQDRLRGGRRDRDRRGRVPRYRPPVERHLACQPRRVPSAGHRARCGGGWLPGRGGQEPEPAAARAGACLRRQLRGRCLFRQAPDRRIRWRTQRGTHQLARLRFRRRRPGRLRAQPGRLPAGQVPGAGPGDHHLSRSGHLHRPRHPVAECATAQQPRRHRRRGRVAPADDHRDRPHRQLRPLGRRARIELRTAGRVGCDQGISRDLLRPRRATRNAAVRSNPPAGFWPPNPMETK